MIYKRNDLYIESLHVDFSKILQVYSVARSLKLVSNLANA